MALKQSGGNFLCPKQGNKIKGVVLNSRVCILEDFCPKHGQGFKPPATRLYRIIGRVPLAPPPPPNPTPINYLEIKRVKRGKNQYGKSYKEPF